METRLIRIVDCVFVVARLSRESVLLCAPESNGRRGHAEIPAAHFGDRQIQADAAVQDTAVIPGPHAHMALDPEQRVGRHFGACRRFGQFGARVEQIEIHQVVCRNDERFHRQRMAGERFIVGGRMERSRQRKRRE